MKFVVWIIEVSSQLIDVLSYVGLLYRLLFVIKVKVKYSRENIAIERWNKICSGCLSLLLYLLKTKSRMCTKIMIESVMRLQ